MDSISNWFCNSSSKNLFVKIVHPGGHVELHDRPVLASELLNRNPKCCVAYPTVFHQPNAIVSPDTMLLLGQKYYVVPIGTIRKLQMRQRFSSRRRDTNDEGVLLRSVQEDDDAKASDDSSGCWLFKNSCNKNGGKEESGDNGCLKKSMSFGTNKSRSSNNSSEGSNTDRVSSCNDASSPRRVVNSGFHSPGRLSLASSVDNWQPGLESIVED